MYFRLNAIRIRADTAVVREILLLGNPAIFTRCTGNLTIAATARMAGFLSRYVAII